MQQSYAKLCGVTETVEVADLVEDSLRLNAGAFARHGVTLCREFSRVPPITVDKHKVLQILVNLMRNAKYACDESGKTEKIITLRIAPATEGVRISVVDNGVGIPAPARQFVRPNRPNSPDSAGNDRVRATSSQVRLPDARLVPDEPRLDASTSRRARHHARVYRSSSHDLPDH
jgi:light-regulated signal transduction histidine kinase (bacteriophytochrome)